MVGVSPIRSPASVAVCAPSISSVSSNAIRTGCVSARSVRASVSFLISRW